MARLAPTPSASSATLFPAPSVAQRPARARQEGVAGRARATPGNRQNRTTTITLTPVLEEVLEQLVSGGRARSLGEAVRQALTVYGTQELGAETIAAIERDVEGKETLNA